MVEKKNPAFSPLEKQNSSPRLETLPGLPPGSLLRIITLNDLNMGDITSLLEMIYNTGHTA